MSEPARPVAFHTSLWLAPDEMDSFLEWKHAEAPVLKDQPGFLGSLVFEESERPGLVHYVSQWSARGDPATLQADLRYRRIAADHGIPLYPPDVRDGIAAPSSVGYRSRFEILERHVGEVLVAESHVDELHPSRGAFVFIYDVDVGDAGGPAYERFKFAEASGQLVAPGFYYRILVRHERRPTVYTYLSVWDSREAADVFHDEFVGSDVYRETYSALEPFRQPPDFRDCRLLHETVIPSRTGAS